MRLGRQDGSRGGGAPLRNKVGCSKGKVSWGLARPPVAREVTLLRPRA